MVRRFAGRGRGAAARARAVALLRAEQGLTDQEIARLLGVTRRAVARVEGLLPPALPAPAAEPLADQQARVEARVRADRARRRRTGLVACAAVVLLTLAGVGVQLLVDHGVSRAAPRVAGLLAWPARGDLAGDRAFRADAARVWRAGAGPDARPTGRIYVLYAGHVGDGRLAVLQATVAGRGLVASVAEHDLTFRHPALTLDATDLLPRAAGTVAALAVGYDGNLGLPGLQPGPGSQVLRLLVAPGVSAADRRSPTALQRGNTPAYRGFVRLALHDGLSTEWLDLSGNGATTAIRLTRTGGPPVLALVPLVGRLLPKPVTVTSVSGVDFFGNHVDGAQSDNDGLLLAEVDGAGPITVEEHWAGQLPSGVPVRLVTGIRPGRAGGLTGFVLGSGADTTFQRVPDRLPAVLVAGTPPALVAIGPPGTTLLRMRAGDRTVAEVRGRAAVLSGALVPVTVQAYAGSGRLLGVARATR